MSVMTRSRCWPSSSSGITLLCSISLRVLPEITSIYVTHDQAGALSLSDRIVVMREGRVMQVGAPADIHDRPHNLFVADFVGYRNVIPLTVTARGADGMVTAEGKGDTHIIAFYDNGLASVAAMLPVDTVEDQQQTDRLKRALMQLPEDKRELLLLSRYQGLRYEEIARLLQCEVGTVKVRVHRALQELRERFYWRDQNRRRPHRSLGG